MFYLLIIGIIIFLILLRLLWLRYLKTLEDTDYYYDKDKEDIDFKQDKK